MTRKNNSSESKMARRAIISVVIIALALAVIPLAWAEGAANSPPMVEGPGNPEPTPTGSPTITPTPTSTSAKPTPTLPPSGPSALVYLPLVARGHPLPAPRAPITTSLSYATNESWAWESCDVAHAGTEWGGWWSGSHKGFRATAEYNADYPGYEFWDFYRGYLWTTIPDVNEHVVRATLRLALCYHTDWPTQTGQVAWHVGTWPQASPLAEDGLEAWRMYVSEPFAVLDGETLPRSYTRVWGGSCDRQAPTYVEVPVPLSLIQQGKTLRILARDTRDAPLCTMDHGTWGTHLIQPETAELRLYVEEAGEERRGAR